MQACWVLLLLGWVFLPIYLRSRVRTYFIYYFLFRNSSCIVLWIFLNKIQFDICFILGLQVFTMPEFLQKRFQSQWVRTYLTVVALFSYVFTKFSVGLVLLWNVKFNISILANYVYCMFSYECSPKN